jgi:hypothetical protein
MKTTLLLLGLLACFSRAEEQVLFAFDDESLPWRDNVHLTLVTGEKHPSNPVLRCGPEGSPDHGHAIIYGTVLQEGGKFRMWYLGLHTRKSLHGAAYDWWRPMCYAESDDGIAWRKPELDLVEFGGSKKNNICLIESEPHSLSRVNDFLTVIRDDADPDPLRRYKCAYIAHLPFDEVRGGKSELGPKESRWCSFVCATSADGLQWKVIGDRPMNASGERFEVAGLYRFGGTYYATGQLISPWTWLPDGREAGRVMLTYRSPDFDHWSRAKAFSFARPGQLTSPPIAGQQTHMGAGFWNRGNVLVGFYGMWQDGPKEKPKGAPHLLGMRIDLGLIVSNDGVHFREPVTDFKMIPRGAEGAWDSISLTQGHAFANVGEKTYVWYGHWDSEAQFRSQEIGLATWRRDGFGHVALHEPKGAGQIVSKQLALGRRIFANVADVKEPLTVEALDDRDRVVASARIENDGLHREVVWTNGKPPGRGSLRVSFPAGSAAKLYAIYIE